MKRVVVFSAVLAAFVTFGYGTAEARDQFPPKAGSVCDAGIAQYKAAMGVEQAGVFRIDSNIERDGSFQFGFYGDVSRQVKGVYVDLPPPPGRTAKQLLRIVDAGYDNGMWLVVTPGFDGQARQAQVFVEIRKGKTCEAIYPQVKSIDPELMPLDSLS